MCQVKTNHCLIYTARSTTDL